jgi:ubiquinone/menaquinone biosynthesis C-methylase UbiE
MKRRDSVDYSQIQQYYDRSYYRDLPQNVAINGHHRRLARKLRIQKDDRVLDVACGTGSWLLAVQEAGALPYGIDISERAIGICKKIMPGGDFRTGVAEALPYDDDQFDVVTCFGSLEHFLNPEHALHEMRRVAREGAYVVILVPNSGFLTRRIGFFKGTHQARAKETVLRLSEWSVLFTEVGLSIAEGSSHRF